MEGIAPNSCTKPVSEKKARPQEQLNCPRCNSTNTKFCYYNNYSLTQPRYFCKTCRRYWTEGGSLRNVPVGGGSRKNKKIPSSSSSSAAAATASSSKVPDLNPATQNPKMHGGQDLNLGFPDMDQKYHHGITSYVDSSNSSSAAPTATISALELLRTGMASRGLNYPYNNVHHPLLMPNSNGTLYPSGFPMQEVKPSLGFSLDHDGLGDHSGRLLFPFGDNQIKQFSGSEAEQNKEQGNSTGYWPGMIGEGSW